MIQELYEINNGFLIRCLGALNFQSQEGEAKNFCDLWKRHWYSRIPAASEGAYYFLLQVFYTPMMWITAWQDCWPDQVITEKPFYGNQGKKPSESLKSHGKL